MRILITIVLLLFSTQVLAGGIIEQISHYFQDPRFHFEKINSRIFPNKIIPSPTKANIFIFDPKKYAWAVYNKEGIKVGQGFASGGKDFCPDINATCRTVVGEYTVFRKEDKDCTSKTFPIDEGGGAPMPHCMFFYKGYAIHGSKNIRQANLSHGCIRVSEKAAEWMNKNYIYEGSLVIVKPY